MFPIILGIMKPNELIESEVAGDMKSPGVYGIYCSRSNKIYIGSTVKIDKRWREHKHYLKNGCHQNSYLQRAWDKYGSDSFCFLVLENCLKHQIRIRESHYLSLLDTTSVFNLGQVGEQFELSQETKDKISRANKGIMPARHTQEAAWAASRGRKESEEHKKMRGVLISKGLRKRTQCSKLNIDQVREIRSMLDTGVKQKEIMEKFNISRVHAYRIKKNQRWEVI